MDIELSYFVYNHSIITNFRASYMETYVRKIGTHYAGYRASKFHLPYFQEEILRLEERVRSYQKSFAAQQTCNEEQCKFSLFRSTLTSWL